MTGENASLVALAMVRAVRENRADDALLLWKGAESKSAVAAALAMTAAEVIDIDTLDRAVRHFVELDAIKQ